MTDVCHLTNVHSPLDHRIYHKQARGLARHGFGVTIIGPARPDGRPLDTIRGCPVRIVTYPRRRTLVGRLLGLVRLWRRAREARADLYHLHDPELLPIGWALRARGARVVYDVHEHFPQTVWAREWVPTPVKPIVAAGVDWAERFLARRLSAVVGVVEAQGARFADRPFLPVRNFPSLSWLSTGGDDQQGAFDLVHVGSLSEDRGALFLLDIVRELRARRPGARLLTIGGFHSDAIRSRWEAKISADGLTDAVDHRLDPIPNDDLGAWIRRGRVALIPGQVSRRNLQSFLPTKLFEYMACGVPVVASDLPSLRQLRTLGEWGVLADPADPSRHAEICADLLDDPARAACMGARGRRIVREDCHWEQEEARLVDLYEQLTGVRRQMLPESAPPRRARWA